MRSAVQVVAAASVLAAMAVPATAEQHRARLSRDLAQAMAAGSTEPLDVIIQADRATLADIAARHGVRVKKWLSTGAVLEASAESLARLQTDAAIGHISGDASVRSTMAVANEAIGADQVLGGLLEGLGPLTGAGVGVAIVDSGLSSHASLRARVAARLDFTGPNGTAEDQLGHGTHVAGIVGGSSEAFRGVAPGAALVVLKVLGADGSGRTSDVINAIDWAIANRAQFGLRVVNLSLGRPVFESWRDDPLCQAVERAVRAGLVVVASAGNVGRSPDGRPIVGGITAPGNSPYAITVGALDTQGTPFRSDDRVTEFSSRGPTYLDGLLKPDLSAPGRRVLSALAPGSTLARTHPELVEASGANGMMRLSGTSMAAGVVSGAAALVLQANPGLTPAQVRLALQLSASFLPEAGVISGGAGSLNVAAAVRIARSGPGLVPSTHIGGESVTSSGLAFGTAAVWGSAETIVWGNGDTIVWGNASTIVWGNSETIVWGNANTIVWGNSDTIVWGNANTIVWGSGDTIVWGNADTIVWGNGDTIVWGNGDTIVWGNAETIVWGN